MDLIAQKYEEITNKKVFIHRFLQGLGFKIPSKNENSRIIKCSGVGQILCSF
jgi:preprotein translocase subunit Sss1